MALNWLGGESSKGDASSSSFSPMQAAVAAKVKRMVSSSRPPPNAPSSEAALAGLLHGRSVYDCAASGTSVAPYRAQAVSLPDSVEGSPLLTEALPTGAATYLDFGLKRMLRGADEGLAEKAEEYASFKPYWDPLLKGRRYRRFVRRLSKRGLVRFTTNPLAEVGCFFVTKKDGSLRWIVDARGPNMLFKDAPGVYMCTSETFARIEVEVPDEIDFASEEGREWLEENGLFSATADVTNYFHRLLVPSYLGRYFCMKGISVSELGDLAGHPELKFLDGNTIVYPYLRSLPMGFTWSLYFGQVLAEHFAAEALKETNAVRMYDQGKTAVYALSAPIFSTYSVYVDNLGVIGRPKKLTQDYITRMVNFFNKRGLIIHEEVAASLDVELLGVMLEGSKLSCRITDKRLLRIRGALRAFCRRRVASGQSLEVLVGHCTFCALINRCTLSVFNSVYKFIRSNYVQPGMIWQSVKDELRVFVC